MGEHRSSPTGHIHVLRDEVARKIAAGEVVERPHSVVRELLDNALDAGAGEIQIHLSKGGMQQIRVVDDGAGMGIADLELCWLPHATSKIETEEDLATTRSLGFRGEALSSIATVARLEIVSTPSDGNPAGRLVVHGGTRIALQPWRGPKGTSVDVGELFYSLPARRKFLRTAGAESAMCRLVILDRALAFPGTGFRYFTEGSLKAFFPSARGPAVHNAGFDEGPTPRELERRILQVFPNVVEQAFLKTVSGSGPGFSFNAVLETPDLFRTDRKFIQIFVNRRRIWDFAFVQAVEYAFAGYLPGGRYPIAFLFINVDPRLVDFNIHPAKREARFRNAAEIHHRIVEVLGSFLAANAKRIAVSGFQSASTLLDGFAADRPVRTGGDKTAVRNAQPAGGVLPSPSGHNSVGFDLKNRLDPGEKTAVRYLGQIMGLFLVAEIDDRLLVVDQHAAHERLLFDRFMSGGPVQSL
ncbi:MAG TPA: DNA mismatch repair endonuclease MutL, partial [Spirochaetia bacterium]|nr:DNA mismatch repair endonuclease MutL [Spirochaetia bacterium]